MALGQVANPRQDPQQRCFPPAVVTYNTDQITALDFDGNVSESPDRVVSLWTTRRPRTAPGQGRAVTKWGADSLRVRLARNPRPPLLLPEIEFAEVFSANGNIGHRSDHIRKGLVHTLEIPETEHKQN